MKEIVTAAIRFVRERLKNCFDGHDYFHCERVYKKALFIANLEKANTFIVGLAAILHDIDNPCVTGDDTGDCGIAREFLRSQYGLKPEDIEKICGIINFTNERESGRHMKNDLEAKVVYDANILDSLGAIGITRALAYGAINKEIVYDGGITNDNTIKYFYDGLFTKADNLYTETAKEAAKDRQEFMERFLQQFYYEWKA